MLEEIERLEKKLAELRRESIALFTQIKEREEWLEPERTHLSSGIRLPGTRKP
jgi:hypothetical protein